MLSRTEVDSSRRSAWAFTRLDNKVFPNTSENVDEVNCPRFLSYYIPNYCCPIKIGID